MGKVLVVYYSRTGNTKKVAEMIAQRVGCDIEEIKTEKSYAGAGGWLLAGKEGSRKLCAKIQPSQKNPADYDLVILGTPIWAWNVSSPVRAYATDSKDKIKRAFAFCAMGGNPGQCFLEIEKILGKSLEKKAEFKDKDILAGKIDLGDFLKSSNVQVQIDIPH